MHLISWKKISLRKEYGGLDISNIQSRNKALLSKWISRWYSERSSKWNQWIRAKYHCHIGDSIEEGLLGKNLSHMMSNIFNLASSNDLRLRLNHSDFRWSLGDGSQILLWFDTWSSSLPLLKLFPKLFSISLWKFSSLKIFITLFKEYGTCSTFLRKIPLREWEKVEVTKLWDFISSEKLDNSPDQLLWIHSGKPFIVKDGYNVLEGTLNVPRWDFYFIWKLRVPPKVQIFLWKVFTNSLPTAQFLKHRIGSDFHSAMCKWCLTHEESVEHLFWDCEIASWAWNFVRKWWGLNFTKHSIWNSFKFCSGQNTKIAWGTIIAVTYWIIWLARNSFIFEGKRTSKKVLEFTILHRSRSWCQALNLISSKVNLCWTSNPMGSILRPNKVSQIGVYNNHRGFCGFIDGSWKKATDQGSSCGVGGYLQDIDCNLLFFFSGPSTASCALVCEYNALFFLLKSIGDSPLIHKKFTFFFELPRVG
ncbi:hypothetical protein POM88_052698 [Heracleum sosnowskyi]|uniref:Reverse transcriptase zinc-binding domain-containing protein n=1 Tax=Heracleum sosnowskyi TaxID=360622 RepID=A0AAD8LW94_9APIA|nr:hypothetical protein POM88_052698 [Heracleum sosnowskyi]